MTPGPSEALGAFGTPRLEVRWQGRGANFLGSFRAALWGPRASGPFDPAASFFKLRIARGRFRGRGIAGSLLWHALLLSISIPLGQMAAPATRLSLPEIQIAWYGPAMDVAPTPKPKSLKPAPQPRPKPQQQIIARAYNPKITVVFNPPHATSRRQLLIEPEAPVNLSSALPATPNVIRWAAAAPVRPGIPINAAEVRAKRREESDEANLRAPRMAHATPAAGPVDILPDPDARVAPPLAVPPSAVHAVRAVSRREAVAAPELGKFSPGSGHVAFAAGTGAGPAPPLPAAPGAIHARRAAVASANVAAPSVRSAPSRLVALSLSPGTAPPPPGNAYAPMSIGPRVGRNVSPSVPSLSGSGEPGGGRGLPAPSASATGPEGLVILHDANPPAPAPPPKSRASAQPKIPHIAPPALATTVPPRSGADSAPMKPVKRQDLAHQVLGPWRIHTLLMNVPNLTSSSGNWVLNYADAMPLMERGEEIIAPLPVHAVDPAYPPALQQEGVQGKVILYAVIGSDGSVSQIRVVQGLDPVLDHDAEVAFSQWKFDPALLKGKPVALRVIVTVPFRSTPIPF